jgi:hypothetical protein
VIGQALSERYTRKVTRRLWAFVVAFVMIGAPVTTTVCQVMCETAQTHDMAAMGRHAHHSCAMVTPSPSTVAVNEVPHLCGHSSNDAVGVQQASQSLVAPAVILVQVFSLPRLDGRALGSWSSRIEHSPPGPLFLSTQLRV